MTAYRWLPFQLADALATNLDSARTPVDEHGLTRRLVLVGCTRRYLDPRFSGVV